MITNTNAINGDWGLVDNFAASEWKQNSSELYDLDFGVILMADRVRDAIGVSMYPSPVDGAFSRKYGSTTSRHYAVGKLSIAGDFFIPNMSAVEVLVRLYAMKDRPKGLGIYLDTIYNGVPCVMIHIDLREDEALWIRDGGEYYGDPKVIARRLS